jgi:spermidine synthase
VDLYLTEQQTDNQRLSVRVTKTLHHEKTDFQDLVIVETPQWGRLLALDGFFQTNEVDEFVYHEMGAHVPLFTHPDPKRVLVVGGGDGGMVREVAKHPGVEHIDLVEIDGRVIETSKQYFPQIAVALTGNPKVHVHVADGIRWVAEREAEYDVIIIDSSEPVGPGEGLFTPEFYANVFKALTGDGLMVAQTESPWTNAAVIKRAFGGISKSFPITRLYTCAVPTYPTGLWSFTLGSKRYDPADADVAQRFGDMKTRYYSPGMHFGALQLPRFVEEITEEAAR